MKHFAPALAAAALLSAASASFAAVAPGPDAFGYTSQELDGFDFRFFAGTPVALPDDGGSAPIDIGFSFNFYGNDYTQVVISSNGYLVFGGGSGSDFSNDDIPDANSPNNIIAGFWDDLNPSAGGTVSYTTQGAVGSREFIVWWADVPHFASDTAFVDFQIILHETSNNIELWYLPTDGDGGNFTVGIENADGTDGLRLFFQTGDTSVFDDEGYLITHPGVNGGDIPAPAALPAGLAILALAGLRRRRA